MTSTTARGPRAALPACGWLAALASLVTYIVLVATFTAFVSSILVLALVPVLPPLLAALVRRDKHLVAKRVKAACWALGFVILILFPAFWLLPDQVYRRVNRQDVLVTPDDPAVADLAQDFLDAHPAYPGLSFEDRASLACDYVLERVQWKLDIETYGLSGHVATPAECIALRFDDCQGQAVTLASLLLHLGFPHVWAVETPFHWYVLARDPAAGALPAGWERDVETLQASGGVLTLNRDGGGSMPPWRLEPVLLIFNDRETLFPVDPLSALAISWTATSFFADDVFPILEGPGAITFFLALAVLAVPVAAWTMYMARPPVPPRPVRGREKARRFVPRVLVAWGVITAIFAGWYVLQPVAWDWTLIIAIGQIAALALVMTVRSPWRDA